MPRVPLYNMAGETVGEVELKDEVFGVEMNEPLLHQVVTAYRANRRVGSADTKTRARVAGGGRKPWRQKGTGRARHGSIRSPLWRGGGITFGPHPRDYRQSLSRSVRRNALKCALSAKVRVGSLCVVDSLALDEPKTREMARVLRNLRAERGALVVLRDADQNVIKSARNIAGVTASPAVQLNALEVLSHDKLVMTRDAVEKVQEVLG